MAENKLGTFVGVFTPTILTILGVIMYLRFGWLVGHLGLLRVLVVVLLANAITLVTTISFSAVATNGRVGVGGAYFIISRSLGLELGGAIGVPLFLSQALSVTLYSYGLAESLRFIWRDLPLMPVTLAIILAVGVLALGGAERALRAQLPLMAFVGLSLAALATGALARFDGGTVVLRGSTGEIGFWAGFAVFFPAVTGVMAGLGLSGDLRNPATSIPLGSILAVCVGLGVYLTVPVLLAIAGDPASLRENPLVWTEIAALGPWLILPGLWSAIFSSAVGSILAAPRTLQALAMDGLAPRVFAQPNNNGRNLIPGMAASIALAIAAVFLGNLNAVAAVVSMFFLTVYGTVNIVAAFEVLSGDPSWRPRIKAPWPLALAGGLACLVVMILINPVAGAAAFLAELGLWLYLSRRARETRWGDARRGLYEALIRWALIRLNERPMSARNWRPHVLVFVDNAVEELDLIRFGDWFSQSRGVVTVCNLVVGDLEAVDLDLDARRQALRDVVGEEKVVVFPETNAVNDVVEGIVSVTQANGIAGLSSNTVLLGWPASKELRRDFLRVVRKLERLKKSVILAKIEPRHMFRRDRPRIHVWWSGLERNGDLLILLAHLLQNNPEWRHARVEILSIASSELMKTRAEAHLARMIPEIRIDATARVILKPSDVRVMELIHQESANAEVVFLGLDSPAPGEEEAAAERLEQLAGDSPAVFFVKNSSMFVGELLDLTEDDESHLP